MDHFTAKKLSDLERLFQMAMQNAENARLPALRDRMLEYAVEYEQKINSMWDNLKGRQM